MTNSLRLTCLHAGIGLGAALSATAAILLFLSNGFNTHLAFAVWLVCINLVTFAYHGYDKRQAMHDGWRVPELVLHLLAVAGGSLGAFAAMRLFRHKTIKGSFRFVFWVIVVVQLGACAVVAYGLWRQTAE
jgi:uncharacterized membrane protein YsdA (DUF1294 family)